MKPSTNIYFHKQYIGFWYYKSKFVLMIYLGFIAIIIK